jgi:hypothetical protein
MPPTVRRDHAIQVVSPGDVTVTHRDTAGRTARVAVESW